MIGVSDSRSTGRFMGTGLGAMPQALLMRLEHGTTLGHAEKAALAASVNAYERVPPRTVLVEESARPRTGYAVVEGFACHYRQGRDGKRQITALLLPGDLYDPQASILHGADHGVATLTGCLVAVIGATALERLKLEHPRLARAFTWRLLTEASTAREWIVGLGTRPAGKRFAHLLCELQARLQAVGLASETCYRLPLTWEDLADTLGISLVHMNRVAQEMRDTGLITFRDKMLTIEGGARLRVFADFSPAYLHLTPP
jgi:CRP-like cAMP-binding protein